jgi:hypothetical protein
MAVYVRYFDSSGHGHQTHIQPFVSYSDYYRADSSCTPTYRVSTDRSQNVGHGTIGRLG